MEEEKTIEQTGEEGISVQDALLAIDVFKKALEHRSGIPKAIVGEEYLALSPEERLNEMLTRRVSYHFSDKISYLFFRFVGAESPIVEAYFYPIEAICSFLDEARSFVQRTTSPDRTEEEREKVVIQHATEMTLIMVDSFYPRAELMMYSFTSEVISEWHRQTKNNLFHWYAERGTPLPYQRDRLLGNTIKDYAKKVSEFWKYQGQTYESWQKIRFAEEYEAIYKHWRRLSKMVGDDDLRVYAKGPQPFQDTPDDLLERLENTDRLDSKTVENKVSELALEHAARRVRLIKKRNVSESVLNQRKKGVRATGYTFAQLFSFLKEGRELIEKNKMIQEALTQEKVAAELEHNGDSAQVKKLKSFEQKMKSIQGSRAESVEQKSDSAQQEKS